MIWVCRHLKQTWLWITKIGRFLLEGGSGVPSNFYLLNAGNIFCGLFNIFNLKLQITLFMKDTNCTNNSILHLRSLKLWMVLRLYGIENLQCYVRNHIDLAKLFEDLVAEDKKFEVITVFILCFMTCSTSWLEWYLCLLYMVLCIRSLSGQHFLWKLSPSW